LAVVRLLLVLTMMTTTVQLPLLCAAVDVNPEAPLMDAHGKCGVHHLCSVKWRCSGRQAGSGCLQREKQNEAGKKTESAAASEMAETLHNDAGVQPAVSFYRSFVSLGQAEDPDNESEDCYSECLQRLPDEKSLEDPVQACHKPESPGAARGVEGGDWNAIMLQVSIDRADASGLAVAYPRNRTSVMWRQPR